MRFALLSSTLNGKLPVFSWAFIFQLVMHSSVGLNESQFEFFLQLRINIEKQISTEREKPKV